METKNLTDTEILTRVNSLKVKHENVKKELIDLLVVLEQKEAELNSIEEEYTHLIGKMVL